MSPYGTLRTGGFCLFDNKIYLIPFPPHQKALEYFCDPHLPLFAVNCPQTPPPLYSVNDEWSTLHSPWNSCDLRPPPAMNNELRGLGESEGFVCFTITVTSFPSKALVFFYVSPPPPPPHWRSIFYSSPLYSISDDDCSLFSSVYLKSKSSLRIKNLPPLPPSTRRWWMMTITLRKIFFMISNQQASVAYRLVAEEDLPLLFSSSDQEAA